MIIVFKKLSNKIECYPVDKGNTIKLNYNETLNSAVVKISHLKNRIDIEPFDEVFLIDGDFTDDTIIGQEIDLVDLYDYITVYDRLNRAFDLDDSDDKEGSNRLYFCVDNYQEQQISLDPVIYNYTISLFSQTKKLENYILPSLSITPHKLSTPITIEEYIKRILSLYGPRRKVVHSVIQGGVEQEEIVEWESTFRLADLPDTFKGTNYCPEMQWTTPTLRDVLNDLFMLRDCIVSLNNNVIGFLDITKTYDEITNYNFITRSRTSQDYSTDLKMNLQNLLQQGSEEFGSGATTSEFLTFTSGSYIVNDQNLRLETQYPILRLKHLYVYWYSSANADDGKFLKVDLCHMRLSDDYDVIGGVLREKYYSLVKEKKEYDTLPADVFVGNIFGGMNDEITNLGTVANYKNTNLYYTRGSNVIEGFSDLQKINLAHETILLKYILMLAEKSGLTESGDSVQDFGSWGSYNAVGSVMNTYFSPLFQIVYETTKEVVFAASKKELLHNERTIMDNQTNAWVNGEAQGRFEYQKANRTGNVEVMINQRSIGNHPIKLGDYLPQYDENHNLLYKEIVYAVEYQVYDNYINVNANAIKNYILKDYFTGINSRVRTWVNAQEDAFIRHDLYKYYIEISDTPYHDVITDCDIALSRFLNPLVARSNYNAGKVNYVGIKTYDGENYYPALNKYYVINLVTRVLGNSIVFTYGFSDNYTALKQINSGEHQAGLPQDDPVLYDGIIAKSDIEDNFTLYRYNPPHIKYNLAANISKLLEINPNDPRDAKTILEDISHSIRTATLGGVPLYAYPYCNHDGNFETLEAVFFSEPVVQINNGESASVDKYWEAVNSNIVEMQIPLFTFNQKVYKDNKEIITSSIQFEFMSGSQDIDVYSGFAKNQAIISNKQQNSLWIYAYQNNHLEIDGGATLNITANGNNCYRVVINPSAEYEDAEYYVISNVLLGDVSDIEYQADIKTSLKTFYINFKQSRWLTGVVRGDDIIKDWEVYLTNNTALSLYANMRGSGTDSSDYRWSGLLLSEQQKSIQVQHDNPSYIKYWVKLGSSEYGQSEQQSDIYGYPIDYYTHVLAQPQDFLSDSFPTNNKYYSIVQDYYNNSQPYKGLMHNRLIAVNAQRISMNGNIVTYECFVPNDFSLDFYSSSTSNPSFNIASYSGSVYDGINYRVASAEQFQFGVWSQNSTTTGEFGTDYILIQDTQRNIKKLRIVFDGSLALDPNLRIPNQTTTLLFIYNMYIDKPIIKLNDDN